jgi:DNA-binding transcriptional LysR family regulator
MDIKHCITFKTILETGSFQKAAHKLSYTQSTVTFHIQQLEKELSVKLFEKIGRKMALTHAGSEMLPHIETILDTAELMRNYGKNYADMGGTLRVAIPDSLLCYGMQPILQAFRNQAPNIRLIIQTLNCHAIRESIINGGADIGIHCDTGAYPHTIMTENLTAYKACLVASPAVHSGELDFMTPGQRKTINFISGDPYSLHEKRFMKYLEQNDIFIQCNMEMWSVDAVKIGVLSNLGIAYLPIYVIGNELKNGLLIPVETGIDDAAVSVIYAYHKNKWVSPAMELFTKLLY